MGFKPSTTPRWADLGSVVEPSSGKKNVGWVAGERPPAQYLNWWQNLVYLWFVFLNDFFSDTPTAQASVANIGSIRNHGKVWLRSNATAFGGDSSRPSLMSEDWLGNVRTQVDHLGYAGGHVVDWREQWRTLSTTVPEGWTATIVNASTGTMTDPTSTFKQRHNKVVLPSAAGMPEYTLVPGYQGYLDNATSLVLEQFIQLTSLTPGAGANCDVGIQLSHAGADDYFIMFRMLAGAGNWRCMTVGSATTNNDSAVAISTAAPYRLRLEVVGSTVTGAAAGTFTARFWINGALVRTQTFTSPGADKFRYYFKSYSTNGGDGNSGILLGRIRMCWNFATNDDV